MKKIISIFMISLLAIVTTNARESAKKSLGITPVKVNPELLATANQHGSSAVKVKQLASAIDAYLINAVTKSGKFTIVERSDLRELQKEQNLAAGGAVSIDGAEAGEMRGAQYLLFVTIDQFNKSGETAVFDGVTKVKERIVISAQTRIVDATTSEVLDSSNVLAERFLVADADVINGQVQQSSGKIAALIPEITREVADKSVEQLVNVVEPKAQVMGVQGTNVILNKGKGVFNVGDIVELYGESMQLEDPETNEIIVIEGELIGKAKVTRVTEKYSIAAIAGSAKPEKGSIVRRVD